MNWLGEGACWYLYKNAEKKRKLTMNKFSSETFPLAAVNTGNSQVSLGNQHTDFPGSYLPWVVMIFDIQKTCSISRNIKGFSLCF